jgi:hypothetical protein
MNCTPGKQLYQLIYFAGCSRSFLYRMPLVMAKQGAHMNLEDTLTIIKDGMEPD